MNENKITIKPAIYGKGVIVVSGNNEQYFENSVLAQEYIKNDLICDYVDVTIEDLTKGTK